MFTVDESGKTIAVPFEAYDDTYDVALKNIATGTGVILVTLVISSVTVEAAPVVGMTLAVAAKGAAVGGISSAAIGATVSGLVTGIETHNVDAALKSAFANGSKDFKWGAIGGALIGGAGELVGLKQATAAGLTIEEVAIIQRDSKYPLSIIKQIKSMDEYNIYKELGLKVGTVNGKAALIQEIDLNYIDEASEMTNLELMLSGRAPIAPDGLPYQLHHINQKNDATLAILTATEHQQNTSILHVATRKSEIDREAFNIIRSEFWENYGAILGGAL